MCPFLFWRSEKHSSHDSGRSKETRPSWARSFQFSIHLTFTHIPLAKLSHKTKPHINMEMLGEGSKYLLNDNHSQLMIMFYFNCQPNKSLCLTRALCLLSCDKGSAVSKPHPPECPGSFSSGYCRWLPCTINFSFSPGSPTSADMLTSSHTKTLSFFDFSSHSCPQLNLLFFIAKFLKRVAPTYSPQSHLQIPTSFYPPVKITVVKVINNHHVIKSNGYCGIHLA